MNIKTMVHREWHKELVAKLGHIVWCELCGATPMILDYAHRMKRRFIGYKTEEDHQEYLTAARLCRKCHTSLDEGQGEDVHGVMYDTITELVNKRVDDIHVA